MPNPKPKHQKSRKKGKVKVKHRKKERKKRNQDSNLIVIRSKKKSEPPDTPSPRPTQQMRHQKSVKWLTSFHTIMVVAICLLLLASLLWFLFQSGCALSKLKQRMKPLPEPHCQNHPTGKIFILIKNPSTPATLLTLCMSRIPHPHTTPETGIGVART